jgi:hypothetical protein
MAGFKVGDQVRWVRAVSLPQYKNAVGTVELIIPDDTDIEDFTRYDIKFPFGTHTLYGTQIEAE